MTRRRHTRYFRDKEWKPPRDLVIPSPYPAQYILPPPGYNLTPSYHCAPVYYACDYQYAQGYHPAWGYQPAQGHYYNWAPNYQSFPSYQPIAAPLNSIPMLPAPSTTVPYATIGHTQFPVQLCRYGPPPVSPPVLLQNAFPSLPY